jgi:putative hemolysin
VNDWLHTARIGLGPLMAVAGVLLSATYNGLEIGCYRISEVRLRLEAERWEGAWRRLLDLTRHRDRLISIILIGASAADYVATAGATIAFTSAGFSPGETELYTTLILAPVLFVVGDMVPKALFRTRADTLTVRGTWILEASRYVFTYVGLLGLLRRATSGVMWLLGHRGAAIDLYAPRDRIQLILLEHAASGVLSTVQLDVARNVLNIRSVTTRQAMTPLADAAVIGETADREQIRRIASESGVSRLLVRGASDFQPVVGYLNVIEALLDEEGGDWVRRFTHPIARVDADQPIMASLVALQQARCDVGLVQDRRGRPIGLATWKDLVEEIVGELTAE